MPGSPSSSSRPKRVGPTKRILLPIVCIPRRARASNSRAPDPIARRTNGKVEKISFTAPADEWAYARLTPRDDDLRRVRHGLHTYNCHRCHTALVAATTLHPRYQPLRSVKLAIPYPCIAPAYDNAAISGRLPRPPITLAGAIVSAALQ